MKHSVACKCYLGESAQCCCIELCRKVISLSFCKFSPEFHLFWIHTHDQFWEYHSWTRLFKMLNLHLFSRVSMNSALKHYSGFPSTGGCSSSPIPRLERIQCHCSFLCICLFLFLSSKSRLYFNQEIVKWKGEFLPYGIMCVVAEHLQRRG